MAPTLWASLRLSKITFGDFVAALNPSYNFFLSRTDLHSFNQERFFQSSNSRVEYQASSAALTFFIALTSSWRMRSAET